MPPHNHTTWACIPAAERVEYNTLYGRVDDVSVAGKAELQMHEVIGL